MLQAARTIQRITRGADRDRYEQDEVLWLAIERCLEIVRGTTRGTFDALKQSHPQIPWRQIAPTRHRLAHAYDETHNDIIWRVGVTHIHEPVQQLEPLVPESPGGES